MRGRSTFAVRVAPTSTWPNVRLRTVARPWMFAKCLANAMFGHFRAPPNDHGAPRTTPQACKSRFPAAVVARLGPVYPNAFGYLERVLKTSECGPLARRFCGSGARWPSVGIGQIWSNVGPGGVASALSVLGAVTGQFRRGGGRLGLRLLGNGWSRIRSKVVWGRGVVASV